jgi:hypothetical protein
MATANPYAAPTARVADAAEAAPPLWNPNAAASWSLLFTPAFGAYLHMLNWRELGDERQAAAAKGWFSASLAVLGAYIALAVAVPDFDARYIGLAYLLTWYFAAARGQARYVKEKYGNDYPRKGWGKALLLAVAAFVGYFFVAVLVGAAAAAAGWITPTP